MRGKYAGAVVLVSGLVVSAGAVALLQPEEIVLTNGDDVFTMNTTPGATDGPDHVRALGGNDRIETGPGDDAVDGGPGNDIIRGGEGDDVLAGGEGNDSIHGETGDDLIYGGPGDDYLNGGPGNDTFFGEDGNDEIIGGLGDDTIDGGAGNDEIHAGPGNDTVVGGGGNDEIYGDDGDDVLNGGDGDDLIRGGRGNDRIFGDAGDDQLYGGEQSDYLDGVEGQNLLNGDAGEDVVIGRSAGDRIAGGSGDDYIVIVGNSVDGITVYDDYQIMPGSDDLIPIDNGTDMLCFVRDVNPDQMTFTDPLPPHNKIYLEFDTGLPTFEAVHLNLPEMPMLAHIEAFRTGDGDDVIVGRDINGLDSYGARFLGTNARFIQVNELFFTGAGNDTVTTGGGDDLVDTGEGDDIIHLCSGNHYVITGGGSDVIYINGDEFDGQGSRFLDRPGRCRIADLSSDDRIVFTGTLDEALFELETVDWEGMPVTKVKYDTASASRPELGEQVDLLGVRAQDVRIRRVGAVIELTVRVEAPVMPPVDPTRQMDRSDIEAGPLRDRRGEGRPRR